MECFDILLKHPRITRKGDGKPEDKSNHDRGFMSTCHAWLCHFHKKMRELWILFANLFSVHFPQKKINLVSNNYNTDEWLHFDNHHQAMQWLWAWAINMLAAKLAFQKFWCQKWDYFHPKIRLTLRVASDSLASRPPDRSCLPSGNTPEADTREHVPQQLWSMYVSVQTSILFSKVLANIAASQLSSATMLVHDGADCLLIRLREATSSTDRLLRAATRKNIS